MHEQFELDFKAETPEEELQRLKDTYKKVVGVPPHITLEKDEIMAGIKNPQEERARLYKIAKEEDDAETIRTYRR